MLSAQDNGLVSVCFPCCVWYSLQWDRVDVCGFNIEATIWYPDPKHCLNLLQMHSRGTKMFVDFPRKHSITKYLRTVDARFETGSTLNFKKR